MATRDAAAPDRDEDASALISARIAELGDWRGAMLSKVRALIRKADQGVVETVKWRKPSNNMRGVPVWEQAGIICTGEVYKTYVKLTFAHGAALDDPAGLFNASLNGSVRRAIDLHQSAIMQEKAFVALIRAAIAFNRTKASKTKPRAAPRR